MIYKLLVQDFVGQHKWEFITYILLIVLFFPIEGILLPKVYGQMFEKIKTISSFTDIYNWRENMSKMNFPGALTVLIGLWGLVIVSYSAKNHIESLLIPSYFSYLRDIIFKNTINSYQNKYNDMKTGDYLARVLELTRNFKDLFQHLLSRFLPEFIVSMLIIAYMFFQHKTIGLILLTGSVICGIINYFGAYELINLVTDRETFFNTVLSENIRDSLDNLMNIFLNNEVDSELKKNSDIEKIATRKLKHIMFMQNVVVILAQLVVLLTFAISIIFLYYLISKGDVKVTHGIVLVIILGQYLNNFLYVNSGFVHNIVYRLGVINTSKEYLDNIFNSTSNRNIKKGITNGTVEFRDVYFKYNENDNDNNWLFEDFNLELEAGGKYAIVGQSGRGKTTLMKMLAGLYSPNKGAIYIDDNDIKSMDLNYLRENVNYVNQRTNMFNESVMYNMLYGNPDATEEHAIALLEKYDLLTVFDELPDGLKSNAGVQGGNLSGGMQRVTMLVRGMLKPCKILILDEPTTGLDKNTTGKVKKLIIEETDGKTLIIITHDVSLSLLSALRLLEV
jgi:ABC-type multidrug transport system fused ATPase/permease subunit